MLYAPCCEHQLHPAASSPSLAPHSHPANPSHYQPLLTQQQQTHRCLQKVALLLLLPQPLPC
jgi:hypothetical protein